LEHIPGLSDTPTFLSIDLKEFMKKNATEAAEAADQSDGFAEIYPEDKYTIVRSLQTAKHVVGMTGDGVNDAPALKQAEVGVAVQNATDAAKAAASVVLTNRGLAGIVELVISGFISQRSVGVAKLCYLYKKIENIDMIYFHAACPWQFLYFFLILLSTSAGAWIIAAHLFPSIMPLL
jgi:H+-transporting ATPase